MISYFAIRQAGTENYLPGSRRSANTRAEPMPMEPGKHPPRLFPTKQSAVAALTAWRMGKWSMGYELDLRIDATCAVRRKSTPMEVVEFVLQPKETSNGRD